MTIWYEKKTLKKVVSTIWPFAQVYPGVFPSSSSPACKKSLGWRSGIRQDGSVTKPWATKTDEIVLKIIQIIVCVFTQNKPRQLLREGACLCMVYGACEKKTDTVIYIFFYGLFSTILNFCYKFPPAFFAHFLTFLIIFAIFAFFASIFLVNFSESKFYLCYF